jgi:RNA polymerase sigma-70 factor (ECF subfamily)
MAEYSTHLTLIHRLATGVDHSAWREFSDRYGQLIRGVARRQGLQDADCDEVVQDVLTSLTRVLPDFQYDPSKGMFRSYLKTITIRATVDCKKRRSGLTAGSAAGVEQAIDDNALEELWEREWRQYHLRRAMEVVDAEFNAKDRNAFQAYAVRGQNAEQIGRELFLSVDQVYQAKSRILNRLAELIRAQIQDEG